jgi:hypothetical protein
LSILIRLHSGGKENSRQCTSAGLSRFFSTSRKLGRCLITTALSGTKAPSSPTHRRYKTHAHRLELFGYFITCLYFLSSMLNLVISPVYSKIFSQHHNFPFKYIRSYTATHTRAATVCVQTQSSFA